MTSVDALFRLSLVDAAAGLRARQFSAVELAESVLARLAETEPAIHAFVEVLGTQVRNEAAARDRELASGDPAGSLHGIPVAVKDIVDVAGVPTRCGSAVRAKSPAALRDAEVVRRLREAGAVIVGKTVTQEFAAGVISEPARNPWGADRIPGGSSGGSAAAVAAGSAAGAIGSDTGGSVRIPASVCGIVGLKPTFGTISTRGVYPLAWSLDTVGPLARTVEDTALLYRAIGRGPGAVDRVSGDRSRPLRIGVARPFFFERLQPGVERSVNAAISLLRQAGFDIVESPWNEASAARAAGFVINRVESSSVHDRDLGLFGGSYGEELRLRLETNALFPAMGYLRALRARSVVRDSMRELFARHGIDALLVPTTPGTAASADRPEVDYPDGSKEHVSLAYTRLTMPFNVTGQPVLALPCGLDDAGLPVSLQLVGRPYEETALCRLGEAVERALADAAPRVPVDPVV